MFISQRVRAIQTPIIPTINQLVHDHPGTISLGQGVAYYGPPSEAFDEIQNRLRSEKLNAYGPVEGLPELCDALAQKLTRKNSICINENNKIFVVAGSNMAFSSLMSVIADQGDEIILLTPYYFNHEMAIRLVNAKPVLVPTLSNCHPDIERISEAITKSTRAIVTISPNNPTGAVYTANELKTINNLCAEYGIYHISDEAYEDFVYDENTHFSPASASGTANHTISLYSFSKAYGFAGWRVGYMLIPAHLFSSMRKVQDTILISPPIISQYAALGALQASDCYIPNNLQEIVKSRRICLENLNQSDFLKEPATSEGAFYIFANLNTDQDDFSLAKQLIQQHGVATIPGCAFETAKGSHIRISYGALTNETVTQGMERLTNGLKTVIGPSKARTL